MKNHIKNFSLNAAWLAGKEWDQWTSVAPPVVPGTARLLKTRHIYKPCLSVSKVCFIASAGDQELETRNQKPKTRNQKQRSKIQKAKISNQNQSRIHQIVSQILNSKCNEIFLRYLFQLAKWEKKKCFGQIRILLLFQLLKLRKIHGKKSWNKLVKKCDEFVTNFFVLIFVVVAIQKESRIASNKNQNKEIYFL